MSAAQRHQTQQSQQSQTVPDAETLAPEQPEQLEQSGQLDPVPVGPARVEPAAAHLTSLDSLFGGALDGASACAVDGTCD